MQRYVPRLSNGEPVKLSWPLVVFRLVNHVYWPIESSASSFLQYLDYVIAFIAFLLFLQTNDAELRYLRSQWNNIDQLLSGVPTYLILVESHLRHFHVMLHRQQFRTLMQCFYGHIYVAQSSQPKVFKRIERQMFANRVVALLYLMVVSAYIVVPIWKLFHHTRAFSYSMIYPFDAMPLYLFLPLLLSNFWVGLLVDTMMYGETNVLGEMMMHLNARYLQLAHDLDASTANILQLNQHAQMARQMNVALVKLLRRNLALNNFAQQLEAENNVRLFLMFCFSGLLLCALSFKAYTSPAANYIYAAWAFAKILELLALGQIGSILATTTDSLSTMYYRSKWEQIIYYSKNTTENIRLMKLVVLAIELNSKPFFVTGLKYFRISVPTVLTILRGAFSYFTFLTSMR